MDRLKYPFGDASVVTIEDAAAVTVEVFNALTIVKNPTLSQATTINLDIDAETPVGAVLELHINQGATARNIVLGTGFVGSGITGVANDKDTIVARYDGTSFRVVSNFKTVDAA